MVYFFTLSDIRYHQMLGALYGSGLVCNDVCKEVWLQRRLMGILSNNRDLREAPQHLKPDALNSHRQGTNGENP